MSVHPLRLIFPFIFSQAGLHPSLCNETILSSTETNTANTQVLDFGVRIVKLILEYSLRSHDVMHLPSGSDTMKVIGFDWNKFFLSADTIISTLTQ